MTPRRRNAIYAIGGVVAGLLGLLVLAQALLPGLAEDRARDDLRRRGGSGISVHVDAVPAVKLLWGKADEVRVRMREFRSGTADLADALDRTRATGTLDARTDIVHIGSLVLRDGVLRKDGDRLSGSAVVTSAALKDALPEGFDVRPVQNTANGLILEATGGAFGFSATVRARLSVDHGALVIAPEGIPILSTIATFNVFSDPRVHVDGVGARPRADGYTVTARGHL